MLAMCILGGILTEYEADKLMDNEDFKREAIPHLPSEFIKTVKRWRDLV